MLKKPTDELMQELLRSNNIESYIKENEKYFVNLTVTEFLNEYVKVKKLVKSRVIKDAEMNEIYGYQIFAGSRNPSRDTLISLCVAMKMTLEEVQSVLKIASLSPLYPKSQRDSIIIFGISQGKSVCDINDELYNNDEQTL